ncbi:hypothetical protein Tsp_03845 [Trichinella spiralis]|uniref:hypothetical protein n=1 Tax=Trichinella spiralis TaxID=6334 RepID=UPI0001EFC2DB|nr:hypothetical protein Tsp_03845 [Trichinella spiralis]
MGSCFTTCNQPSRGSPNLSIEQSHPQYFNKMKVETLKQNRFAPKENLRFSLSAGELKLLRWLWKQMKQVHQGLASAKLFQIIFATCPEIKRFFGLAKVSDEKALIDERMRKHMLILQASKLIILFQIISSA